MTFILLLVLIYLVMGSLTVLEIRVIGIPNMMHECSVGDCAVRYRNTWRCSQGIIGRGPLTLFGWIGVLLGWPIVGLYVASWLIISITYWIGTRRI